MALLTKEYKNYTLTLDPGHDDIWQMYKKHLAAFWTFDEVKLHNDLDDWNHKLSDADRTYISYILAYFASSDGIVNANLMQRFSQEITVPEAVSFYTIQIAIEQIHARTYAMLLETYIPDKNKRDHLEDSMNTVKSIKMKADWALKWINDQDASLAQRLVAFTIIEGVFFSGSFCGIFWIKKRGLMPGLVQSNELISRDEGMHTDFGVLLYTRKLLPEEKLPEHTVHEMMKSAMECERAFIDESIPEELIGMNSDLMVQYVEYVADRLLMSLGYNKLYNSENPFDWMNMISVESRTNFFERNASEYQKYTKQEFELLSLDDLK